MKIIIFLLFVSSASALTLDDLLKAELSKPDKPLTVITYDPPPVPNLRTEQLQDLLILQLQKQLLESVKKAER